MNCEYCNFEKGKKISVCFVSSIMWQALYYTGNYNADLAAAWIFENQDKNLDAPLTEVSYQNYF